jgi:hypothetical protein
MMLDKGGENVPSTGIISTFEPPIFFISGLPPLLGGGAYEKIMLRRHSNKITEKPVLSGAVKCLNIQPV